MPGLKVGNAADARLKSGVTVLTADRPFVAAVDIRGGAPGTRETDLLAAGRMVAAVDALVLAGGSAFGLDAASGVADRLRALGRGFRAGGALVPIVPGAILFDLANGGDKAWTTNPYRALGAAALDAAAEDFAIGSGRRRHRRDDRDADGRPRLGLARHRGRRDRRRARRRQRLRQRRPCPAAAPSGPAPFEIGDEFGGLGPAAAARAAVHAAPDEARPRRPAAQHHHRHRRHRRGADKAQAPPHGRGRPDRHGPRDPPGPHPRSTATSSSPSPPSARALPEPPVLAELALGHAAALCLARAIARAVHAASPAPGNLLPCWSETEGR